MLTNEELEKQLKNAKEELKNVKGPQCEVFSRVVGYMRPVQAWNKGKKEEYSMRKTYDVEGKKRPNGCC